MASPIPARICLGCGAAALALSIWNQLSADRIDPPLERASVLASLLAVGLLLIGSLWIRIVPRNPEQVVLPGAQGFELAEDLSEPLRSELAWGSPMLLTATPAAVVVLHWRDRALLRRGLLNAQGFLPGSICARALDQGRAISLVDLRLYPGRAEFETLLPGLPSVLVQPVGSEGLLVLGGWAPRCFDRSDLAWVEGWARKISAALPGAAGSALSLPGG
ncbi:MAG: cofactor assembly of complex C subunit B [Synechococcaceae cyanobacterium]|nr:cofactor assembly of complex C subunit B [Synechococcaceae cyanobacterium]